MERSKWQGNARVIAQMIRANWKTDNIVVKFSSLGSAETPSCKLLRNFRFAFVKYCRPGLINYGLSAVVVVQNAQLGVVYIDIVCVCVSLMPLVYVSI